MDVRLTTIPGLCPIAVKLLQRAGYTTVDQIHYFHSFDNIRLWKNILKMKRGPYYSNYLFKQCIMTIIHVRTIQIYHTHPRHFICPISLDIMTDPVIAPSGISYDRKNIQEWLSRNKTSMNRMNYFYPNNSLKEAVHAYLNKMQ
jgi:hypothetical protein